MTGIATQLVHHAYRPPAGFEAPQVAVHKASTVYFPDVAALRTREWKQKEGYTYGLHGTPTTFVLEERLATLEGGLQCLLAPSGLSAIALVDLALLKTGDEVLIPHNAYGPGLAFAQAELAAYGIGHRLYDAMDADDLRAKLSERTRLVWVEAAGSVSMEFPDLQGLVRACRERPGVAVALDNTWGAGLAFDAFDLGDGLAVDASVHALTKYPSGGGDVLMGSVVTRDGALHLRIKLAHMRLGLGVGANDAELVLRALPSIDLRYRAHDATARELACWLQSRPEVAAVLHPALPGSPGHDHWRKTCGARDLAAGLFSIVFASDIDQPAIDRFCDGLRRFRIGFSWGGPCSLVVPYDMASMRDAATARWPHAGGLVRFSIGLEAAADLIGDLRQSLDAMRAAGAG
jgi:cystathionine beta-lyase